MTPDRLQTFIETLRLAGFNIGAQQHLAAQALLVQLAARNALPVEVSRWCGLLRPLLCSTPREQADFARYFNEWAAQFHSAQISPAAVQEADAELKQIRIGLR